MYKLNYGRQEFDMGAQGKVILGGHVEGGDFCALVEVANTYGLIKLKYEGVQSVTHKEMVAILKLHYQKNEGITPKILVVGEIAIDKMDEFSTGVYIGDDLLAFSSTTTNQQYSYYCYEYIADECEIEPEDLTYEDMSLWTVNFRHWSFMHGAVVDRDLNNVITLVTQVSGLILHCNEKDMDYVGIGHINPIGQSRLIDECNVVYGPGH